MLINKLLKVLFDYWDHVKLRYINSLLVFYNVYWLFFNLFTFLFLLHCVATIDPYQIFLLYLVIYFWCQWSWILANANQLLFAKLILTNFKKVIQSISGSPYDIANKVGNAMTFEKRNIVCFIVVPNIYNKKYIVYYIMTCNFLFVVF